MKILKNLTLVFVLLIGVFAFSKAKSTTEKVPLNLDTIDVIQTLSSQELECRPTSELYFYVETNLVKKSRGSSTINASIYVLDKTSGLSNLLANDTIVVPFHKETVLDFETLPSNCKTTVLTNGDTVIGSNTKAPFCFNELIQYEKIYNSYNNATNKLLHIQRTL
ncbi:hypothetical protein [uncultured Polaribacter sp.]|uniref:hypothetical protein n=1 Tax=uncultured Polaribacter sp. TaxID=174711 RepID=UPI0030D75D6B|tara:strand:- start:1721 stop:2215 length:495 start_codon:yes stop_codon:yes gene_type:complete